MKIYVVGAGKLANAILHSEISQEQGEVLQWETHYKNTNENAILVHAGSGRQLKECFEFCTRTKSVFVELSTGLETETMSPDFPLIICPNTSILLLKTMHILKMNGGSFKNYTISITESHQSAKTTEAGTAFAFADSLQFPHDKIISIRDPKIQKDAVGIPQEYLDKHAYHKISISDGNDEVTIETKVLGHNSYAKGVKEIIKAIVSNTFENRSYTVLELIDNKML